MIMLFPACGSDLANRSGLPKCHHSSIYGPDEGVWYNLVTWELLCQNTHCGKGPLMAFNLKERSSVVLDHCYPLPHLSYLKLGEKEEVWWFANVFFPSR